ncbi:MULTISPECIES: ABC transporter permease subunit [Blautia]|uniref:ABC transporter permease subunit n=1 Tax=Blautia TaxID=572511 RepID=UPI00156F365A|nr:MULTISPECIES: ABC transporter permease subunit [Blautia]MCB6328574.1 ABC transporter permease subunit [Blautia faecis]MCB6626679.1 ABC transporter permease subunit [Blautia sp. 210702-DFI.1.159]NSG93421.1 ABC transporter permease subunit [Blautia faecis]
MKNKTSRNNIILLVLAVVCLIAGIGLLVGQRYCSGKTQGIESSNIVTGAQNTCIAYDSANEILIVGTHNNEAVAFKDGTEIWRQTSNGAYSAFVIDAEQNIVYASSEDNHVYIYNISDGSAVNDINTQRRIVAMDVSKDGKIAVATSTGSSKANVLLYDKEGNELLNQKSKIKINGIEFTNDNENIIIGNNRGEIIKMDLNGQELSKYATNYTVLQIIPYGEYHLAVCKNGGYFGFDDDLNIIRQGEITNTAQAVVTSVGTDSDQEYIAVGTQEGYLYILDGSDKQIYVENTDATINAFAQDGENIYMAGASESVQTVHVANLANMESYVTLANIFLYTGVIVTVLGIFLLLMAIPGTRKKICKLGKSIWKHKIAYILLLPTFLLVWFFNYRGILTAFVRAFTNWSTTNNTVAKMEFVGLDNFRRMFSEGYFLIGMKNLVLLIVTGVLKVLTMPLIAAWLVYAVNGNKRKYIYRFLFVLPVVVPVVVMAMTWQKIYDPNIGLLNEVLGVLGMTGLQQVWLGNAKTAIWAIIFMGFPFISAMAFLVYYGGFINIGKEIEESARVDGANRHQIFWKIQLPMIKPQLSIMITLTLISVMQDFNNIYIMTGGGPGTSTYVPALELYLNVAQFGRYGYACALGVVLFAFTMAITLINMRLTREKEV